MADVRRTLKSPAKRKFWGIQNLSAPAALKTPHGTISFRTTGRRESTYPVESA